MANICGTADCDQLIADDDVKCNPSTYEDWWFARCEFTNVIASSTIDDIKFT